MTFNRIILHDHFDNSPTEHVAEIPGLGMTQGEIIDGELNGFANEGDPVQFNIGTGKWHRVTGQSGAIYHSTGKVQLLPALPVYSFSNAANRLRKRMTNYDFDLTGNNISISSGDYSFNDDLVGRRLFQFMTWVKKRPNEVWDEDDFVDEDDFKVIKLRYIYDSPNPDEIGTWTKESSLDNIKITSSAYTTTFQTADADDDEILATVAIDTICGDRGFFARDGYSRDGNDLLGIFGQLEVVEATGTWITGRSIYYSFDGNKLSTDRTEGLLRYGIVMKGAYEGDKAVIVTSYGFLQNEQRLHSPSFQNSGLAWIQPSPAVAIYYADHGMDIENGWGNEDDEPDVDYKNYITMVRCYRATIAPYTHLRIGKYCFIDREGEVEVPPICCEYTSDWLGKIDIVWAHQGTSTSQFASSNYLFNNQSRDNNVLIPRIEIHKVVSTFKSWHETHNPDLGHMICSGITARVINVEENTHRYITEPWTVMKAMPTTTDLTYVNSTEDSGGDSLSDFDFEHTLPYRGFHLAYRAGIFSHFFIYVERVTEDAFDYWRSDYKSHFAWERLRVRLQIIDRSKPPTEWTTISEWIDLTSLDYIPNKYAAGGTFDAQQTELGYIWFDIYQYLLDGVDPIELSKIPMEDIQWVSDAVISYINTSNESVTYDEEEYDEDDDGSPINSRLVFNSTFKSKLEIIGINVTAANAGSQPIPVTTTPYANIEHSKYHPTRWYHDFPEQKFLTVDKNKPESLIISETNDQYWVKLPEFSYSWSTNVSDDEHTDGSRPFSRNATKSTTYQAQVFQLAHIDEFKSINPSADLELKPYYLLCDNDEPIDWIDQPVWFSIPHVTTSEVRDSDYNDIVYLRETGDGLFWIPKQSFEQRLYVRLRLVTFYPSIWNPFQVTTDVTDLIEVVLPGRT